MKLNKKELILGLSEKADGAMKGDRDNQKNFLKKLKIEINKVTAAGLAHGAGIKIINKKQAGKMIKGVDALITKDKGVFLTITVADCLPVYFCDKSGQTIGIAHIGWRGAVKNLAGKVINRLVGDFKLKPENIVVYIGPHIKTCHFEVKAAVAKKFLKYQEALSSIGKKVYIDLGRVVKKQLAVSGVPRRNVKISQECTYCLENKYFSYRRDKPKKLETMLAYIGLKDRPKNY